MRMLNTGIRLHPVIINMRYKVMWQEVVMWRKAAHTHEAHDQQMTSDTDKVKHPALHSTYHFGILIC